MSILLILIFLLVIIAVAIAVTWKRFDGGKPPTQQIIPYNDVKPNSVKKQMLTLSDSKQVKSEKMPVVNKPTGEPTSELASEPTSKLADIADKFEFFPFGGFVLSGMPLIVPKADDVTHISDVIVNDNHIVIITAFNDVLSCNIDGYEYVSSSENSVTIESNDKQYVLSLINENGEYKLIDQIDNKVQLSAKSCILLPVYDGDKVYTNFNDKKYVFLPSGKCSISALSMMSSSNGHVTKASQNEFTCDNKNYMFINIKDDVYILVVDDRELLKIDPLIG
jgi:hypothetical protein